MATPRFTLSLFILTIAQTLTYCSQLVLLVSAFVRIPILDGYLATFAVMFTKSLLPISLGGLGPREATYVGLMGLAGIAPEPALVLALTREAMNLATTIPGAIIYALGPAPRQASSAVGPASAATSVGPAAE